MPSSPKPSALEETVQEVQEREGARVMATWSKAQSHRSYLSLCLTQTARCWCDRQGDGMFVDSFRDAWDATGVRWGVIVHTVGARWYLALDVRCASHACAALRAATLLL